MKARKAKRRPKARKAREVYLHGYTYTFGKNGMVEIDGHLLDAAQFRLFERKVEGRWEIANRPGRSAPIDDPQWYARSVGLSDLLHEYKPYPKAKDRLLRLSLAAAEPLNSIASMREYSWFGDESVRTAGCALIEQLLKEAELRIQRLRHFKTSMALEHATKLQDWIKREEEFGRIGEEPQS